MGSIASRSNMAVCVALMCGVGAAPLVLRRLNVERSVKGHRPPLEIIISACVYLIVIVDADELE